MNHYNQLWVEKYRPQKLNEVILSPEIQSHFTSLKEDIPNLLFYGSPGTGKSTLAKIIVKDILQCQYLYINASDENGIDTIRNKVISFAQTRSIDSKKKIVILEEADGLTGESLRILRNVMEEYCDTTRFILTANYINKIIEPIRSRCVLFKLHPDLKDCLKRCVYILKEEGVKVSSDQKNLLLSFIESRYPDLRRIINDLQKFSINGELIIKENDNIYDTSEYVIKSLIERKNSLDIRKYVIESEKLFNNDYHQLLRGMFDFVYSSQIPDNVKKIMVLEIGEYMYRDAFVLDHEINFFCCVLALEKCFN